MAVGLLRDAGAATLADRVERELVGRNVLHGRWTFQVVEDYDDNYYGAFTALEREAREQLAGGKRHLFDAELKEARPTPGKPHPEASPRET